MTLALAAIVHELASVANIVTVNAEVLEAGLQASPPHDADMLEALRDLAAAAQRLPGLMDRLRKLGL